MRVGDGLHLRAGDFPKKVSVDVYHLVFDGIIYQFGICFQIHLGEDAGSIGTDGFVAEHEFKRNLFKGFSGSYQTGDMVFTD